MKNLLLIIALSCISLSAVSEDYAVTFAAGDKTGIPDGWPVSRRLLKNGEALRPGETFVTAKALNQIMAERSAAMAARDEAMAKAVEDKAKAEEKNFREAKRDLKTALKNWDSLTAADQRAITPTIIRMLLIMLKDDGE